MTVNMKLVPNPADGLAQAVGDLLNKGLGFGKNTIDLFSVATTCVIGLLFAGSTATLMIPELIEARGYFAFGGEWMLFGVFYIIGYLGMKYINERGTEQ